MCCGRYDQARTGFFCWPQNTQILPSCTAALEFVVQKKLAAEKAAAAADEKAEEKGTGNRQLFMQFTCNKCEGVSQYMINKNAYDDGIVICTCQTCHVRHLIADNLKKVNGIPCVCALHINSMHVVFMCYKCSSMSPRLSLIHI